MKLTVQANGVCIGWLSLDAISGLYAFDYSVAWLAQEQRFPLSPVLPLVGQSLPAEQHSANARQFFQNLLPEGQALDDAGASDAALTAATLGGSSLSNVFKSKSFQYAIGPSLVWDVFNYGRITNQVRVEDARFQQLLTHYQDTALKAAQRSTDLSLYQYSEGLVDYQRVLDSQRSLLAAQEQYTRVSGDVITHLIALYKSLGGGWEARVEIDFVPAETRRALQERTDWGDLLTPGQQVLPVDEKHRAWRWPDW